ncbi:hypothetical protein VN97_g5003 [Penicillium thymicola]|uniref:Uncharacterized protein n=1 Tax=Penicillium thymicola TaxID=293382 RepID=A0AAI9X8U3_PENTH|nr:hypothetical protein VN97_g5003 [Penicillium thymicola]
MAKVWAFPGSRIRSRVLPFRNLDSCQCSAPDVVMLPASGYIVIAPKANNPGVSSSEVIAYFADSDP